MPQSSSTAAVSGTPQISLLPAAARAASAEWEENAGSETSLWLFLSVCGGMGSAASPGAAFRGH